MTWTNVEVPEPAAPWSPPKEWIRPKNPEPPSYSTMDEITRQRWMAPIIAPRQILARLLEEDEKQWERELAKLPVQPLAIPMCGHCSEIELHKRSRN
jgi:hypothetical protein